MDRGPFCGGEGPVFVEVPKDMSEEKIKRRRFLADILFAGGAISAAALVAKATQATANPGPVAQNSTPPGPPTPPATPAVTPSVKTPPEPQLGGAVVCPTQVTPVPPPVNVRGEVALPQTRKTLPVPKLGGEPMMPARPAPPR